MPTPTPVAQRDRPWHTVAVVAIVVGCTTFTSASRLDGVAASAPSALPIMATWDAVSLPPDAAALLSAAGADTAASSAVFGCDPQRGFMFVWPSALQGSQYTVAGENVCYVGPQRDFVVYCCNFTLHANRGGAMVIVPVDAHCQPLPHRPAFLQPTTGGPPGLVWKRSSVYLSDRGILYTYGGTTVAYNNATVANNSACGNSYQSYLTDGWQCALSSQDTYLLNLSSVASGPSSTPLAWTVLPASVTGSPPSETPPYNCYQSSTAGMTHVYDPMTDTILALGAYTQDARARNPVNVLGQAALWVFDLSSLTWRFRPTTGQLPTLETASPISSGMFFVHATNEAAGGPSAAPSHALIVFGGLSLNKQYASGGCAVLDLDLWVWTQPTSCQYGAGVFLRGDGTTIASPTANLAFLVGGFYTTNAGYPFYTFLPSSLFALDVTTLSWEMVDTDVASTNPVWAAHAAAPGTLFGATLLHQAASTDVVIPPGMAAANGLPLDVRGDLIQAYLVGGAMVNSARSFSLEEGWFAMATDIACQRFFDGYTAVSNVTIGDASLMHVITIFVPAPPSDGAIPIPIPTPLAAWMMVSIVFAAVTGLVFIGMGVAWCWPSNRGATVGQERPVVAHEQEGEGESTWSHSSWRQDGNVVVDSWASQPSSGRGLIRATANYDDGPSLPAGHFAATMRRLREDELWGSGGEVPFAAYHVGDEAVGVPPSPPPAGATSMPLTLPATTATVTGPTVVSLPGHATAPGSWAADEIALVEEKHEEGSGRGWPGMPVWHTPGRMGMTTSGLSPSSTVATPATSASRAIQPIRARARGDAGVMVARVVVTRRLCTCGCARLSGMQACALWRVAFVMTWYLCTVITVGYAIRRTGHGGPTVATMVWPSWYAFWLVAASPWLMHAAIVASDACQMARVALCAGRSGRAMPPRSHPVAVVPESGLEHRHGGGDIASGGVVVSRRQVADGGGSGWGALCRDAAALTTVWVLQLVGGVAVSTLVVGLAASKAVGGHGRLRRSDRGALAVDGAGDEGGDSPEPVSHGCGPGSSCLLLGVTRQGRLPWWLLACLMVESMLRCAFLLLTMADERLFNAPMDMGGWQMAMGVVLSMTLALEMASVVLVAASAVRACVRHDMAAHKSMALLANMYGGGGLPESHVHGGTPDATHGPTPTGAQYATLGTVHGANVATWSDGRTVDPSWSREGEHANR